MHIVYVSREYQPSRRGGGIATYLKEVAEQFVRMGHQVTVVAASDDTRKKYEETINGVRVIRLAGGDFVIPSIESTRFYRRFRPSYRFRSYRRRVFKTVKSLGQIDVLEVADFGAEALYLEGLGIPFTIRMHTPSLFDRATEGLVPRTLRNFWMYSGMKTELALISRCRHITSCSESLSHWTVANTEATEEEVKVIYNPVNYQSLSTGKEEYILEQGQTNIVFVGTVCETKGCRELVEAAIAIKDKYPTLHLWLFGKMGMWADALKKEYQSYEWIHFYGKIERDLLFSIYQHAALVCLPSWWDNLPMTCIEAMMAGGLVLGSNAGGMSEMLSEGKTGFLVKPKSAKVLADRVDEILSLPEEVLKAIREQAKETAIETYSTENIAQQLLDYYKSIIK